MSVKTRIPESEGLDVTVRGAFNPAIFHPEWFLRHRLLEATDTAGAEVHVLSGDYTEVNFPSFKISCLKDQFQISGNIAVAPRINDILAGVFTLLVHTPVKSCAINPWAHYQCDSEDYWHKVGHMLVPKDLIWKNLFNNPGMLNLTVMDRREGDFPGVTNAIVQPSNEFKPGFFLRVNYHFTLPDSDERADPGKKVCAFLQSEWDKALAFPRKIAEVIFNNIPGS